MEILKYIAYIALALIILLVMITIHELGHYLAGKMLKFKINEFSIGFGPKLFSRRNKKTGELFSLRAIPLGGFCAFEGETEEEQPKKDPAVFSELKEGGDVALSSVPSENSAGQKPIAAGKTSDKKESWKNDTAVSGQAVGGQTVQTEKKFNDHEPWKRIVVFLFGGLFNILSAVIFSFIFILAVGLEEPPVVASVYTKEDNITAYNPFEVGDRIVKIDGKKVTYLYTVNEALANAGDTAEFTVERADKSGTVKEITFTATKQTIRAQSDLKEDYVGFGYSRSDEERTHSFGKALLYSVPYTGKMSWAVLSSLGKLITGRVPLNQVSGPVGTITAIAEISILNWRNILLLLPLIAANLGIFNLLPIPALDGSKIVFAAIEWIRKKPVNRNVENIIHVVGLFVLFGFVILVDIIGLFSRCGV